MRRPALLALASVMTVTSLRAQTLAPTERHEVPPIIRYGKWGAAALFAGFTTLGVVQHRNANQAFSRLQDFCRVGGSCAIGPDGRYANPAAESRYQDVVSNDRAARAWLISGQVALAGATAMFIVELLQQRETRNIPLQGLLIEPGAWDTRIGWSVAF